MTDQPFEPTPLEDDPDIIEAARATGYVPIPGRDALGHRLDEIIVNDLQQTYDHAVDQIMLGADPDHPARDILVDAGWRKIAAVFDVPYALLGFETLAERDARRDRAIWERLHPRRATWQAWSGLKRYQARCWVRATRVELARRLGGPSLHDDCGDY